MQANVESLGEVGMHETNKKVSAQNIEIGSRKQPRCPPTLEANLHSECPHPKHPTKIKVEQHKAKGDP
jgi:hypothetical protein